MSDIQSQLKNFTNSLKKALDQIASLNTMDEIGKLSVQLIQTRTRRGYSVEESGKDEKTFEKLSRAYIERRKGKKQTGERSKQKKLTTQEKLSGYTSPTKSNLTFTGKMIEALTYRLFKGKVEILPGDKRAKNLTQYHEEGNSKLPKRPYMHLSKKEIEKVRQLFERKINSVIRKLATK